MDMIKVSTKVSAQNENIKKLRKTFVHEKAMITTTLIFSCYWKSLLPFYLQKKRPFEKTKSIFNANSELLQNHTEKQLMSSKTTLN